MGQKTDHRQLPLGWRGCNPAYRDNAKCRAAVKRKFEVSGEACARIRNRSREIFRDIEAGPQISGFRNRLIHGYNEVDDAIVWGVILTKILILGAQVAQLEDRYPLET